MRGVIDLFAGIGGFSLAAHRAGLQTVRFVEKNPFCRRVLEKNFPGVPIHDDVRTYDATKDEGAHVVTLGFPCQNVSSASADESARGIDGQLSGLWWEGLRVVAQSRPRWVLVENVHQLVSRGLDRVASSLEQEGYRVWPVVLGAGSAGAPHKRLRFFLVAHSDRDRQPAFSFDAQVAGMVGQPARRGWDGPRPRVCRVDDGLPRGMDRPRLAALGNAVCPDLVYPLFLAIARHDEAEAKAVAA